MRGRFVTSSALHDSDRPRVLHIICRHAQPFSQVLPPRCRQWRFTWNISWICPCVLSPLTQLSGVRGVEDEEDDSDKVAAAPCSSIPRHLLLLSSVHHDNLFISSATSPTLWLNPSATVSAAEACGGQVSNGYGTLKMHGGAIQSLTTEGNVKPLQCPPLTGVV